MFILLDKLEHYGIRGVAIDSFCTYLTNMHVYIYYINKISGAPLHEHRVPQGSVLGPLFF